MGHSYEKICLRPRRHTTLYQRYFNVDATFRRRIDVDTTLFWRHIAAGRGFHQVRSKPARSTTETSYNIEIVCVVS